MKKERKKRREKEKRKEKKGGKELNYDVSWIGAGTCSIHRVQSYRERDFSTVVQSIIIVQY